MSDKLNLIDRIAREDKFSTFARLMRTSSANNVFDGEGEFTVFAPTNDAFAKLPDHTLNGLLSEDGQTRLRNLLSYHILPGKVMAGNLASAPSRKAFTGEELLFTDISGLKVNGASIQARNFEATNGVIHALDTVLTPKMSATTATTSPPLVTPTAISSRTLSAVPDAPVADAPSATSISPVDSPVLAAVPALATPDTAQAATKSVV